MSALPADYLTTLSQINNVLHLLAAFGLESEAASLAPMLQKSPGGAGRSAGDAAQDPGGPLSTEIRTENEASTTLDTALRNIRTVLDGVRIEEIARQDCLKPWLARVFQLENRAEIAARLLGCNAAHMVLRSLDWKDPVQAHLIPYVCDQIACPACSRRKSVEYYSRIMLQHGPRIDRQPDTYPLRWIVLDIENPAWGSLAPALDDFQHAWRAMRRSNHALWSDNVRGYLFNFEVTCNRKRRSWHPHLHLLYSGNYIPAAVLQRAWRRRLGGRGRIGRATIGSCYAMGPDGHKHLLVDGAGSSRDVKACVYEAAKYTFKPFECRDIPGSVLVELRDALYNRRLRGTAGDLATSKPKAKTRFRNLGGLKTMLKDYTSPYYASPGFSAHVMHAAARDVHRWFLLVRTYSLFFDYQNNMTWEHDRAKMSPELSPLEGNSS